jgi:hypothetical protein
MCNGGHGGSSGSHAGHGRAPRALAVMLALVFAALLPVRAAAADARERAPRVVWAGEGRLYVAAPDSGTLAPRMLVRVLEKGREIAAGEITRVLDGVLASVRLASGGVEAGARLDALAVELAPATVRPAATLRVGVPASGRGALAPPCDAARLDPSALPRAYRTEALADGATRLVAADSAAGAGAWPETLLVRAFADRADEEIALERGDLDVAVFWPGEPSARLRERVPGIQLLRGLRARGAIVARAADGDSVLVASVLPRFSALDAELFAGDLLPWGARPGAADAAGAGVAPGAGAGPVRYSASGFPGAAAAMRFLNRNMGSARVSFGTVLVSWADLPAAASAPPEPAGLRPGEIPVLALRCPVLCSAARADDVRALGADAFANLAACGTSGRRP